MRYCKGICTGKLRYGIIRSVRVMWGSHSVAPVHPRDQERIRSSLHLKCRGGMEVEGTQREKRRGILNNV